MMFLITLAKLWRVYISVINISFIASSLVLSRIARMRTEPETIGEKRIFLLRRNWRLRPYYLIQGVSQLDGLVMAGGDNLMVLVWEGNREDILLLWTFLVFKSQRRNFLSCDLERAECLLEARIASEKVQVILLSNLKIINCVQSVALSDYKISLSFVLLSKVVSASCHRSRQGNVQTRTFEPTYMIACLPHTVTISLSE